MDTEPDERLLRSCAGMHALTLALSTPVIKEDSERFVGVATLLDNGQGSTQVFLAPWPGHVTCSLKDE